MGKPRVGVVVTELGIPSEVWILRQCAGFKHIEPVILCWSIREGFTPPAGLEVRQFRTTFEPPRTLARRLASRLGLSWAVLPNARRRADIAAVVQAARLDAVFCHFAWAGLALTAALPPGMPIAWQVHGRDVSAKLGEFAFRRAVARALPKLGHLIAVGRFQIDRLAPLGLSARHSVIPCGAPLDQFARRPPPERADGQPLRFIAVGRLSHEKGVLQTLAAFEQVAAQRPDVELVFLGDGPLAGDLARAVAQSPAKDRIDLAGLATPAEVAAALSDAHVFVQHSREVNGWVEGFGVTLTEAGAAGLPLVVSSLGGIVDQVEDGANGFLFAPGDVAAQAQAMLRLADDEPLRRRMGEAARCIAATFDAEVMTEKLETVLLALAAGRA